MKKLLIILSCSFIVSLATVSAQYERFTASVGGDVTQLSPKTVSYPFIGTQYWISEQDVYLTAVTYTSVTRYRGTGTLTAIVKAGLIQESGNQQCPYIDISSSKGPSQTGSVSANDSRTVWAAYLETPKVEASNTGGTEGSAFAQLTITW